MKVYLVKQLSGQFKLADGTDYEKAKKIKLNEIYECEIKQPRNLKFHRKFFALLTMVFENQEQYTNMEHLRKDLIIAAGHYDLRYNFDGLEICEAKSISFAKMTEDEFGELYNSVIDVIVKYFHFDREEILQNIEQFF